MKNNLYKSLLLVHQHIEKVKKLLIQGRSEVSTQGPESLESITAAFPC